MDETHQTIELPDGRLLDLRASGPTGGPTLLFHHGTPGARTGVPGVEQAAHDRGLRFVTFSRPGYGGSTRRAGRSIADVVEDARAVLDAVGAERCLVAGWSGGGPHALACAARLERASAVAAIASIAPADARGLDWTAGMGEENVQELGIAREGEVALRPYLEAVNELLKDVTSPAQLVEALGSLLPEVDREALDDDFARQLTKDSEEGLRHGVDGWLDDDLAFTRPWGFDLSEISAPTAIWQGSEDLMVPFAHGRWLSDEVPGVAAHLLDGEGHLSMMTSHGAAVVDGLLDAAGLR